MPRRPDRAGEIQRGGRLAERELAGVERRAGRVAERYVRAVVDAERERVAAIDRRQIPLPPDGPALEADRARPVVDVGLDERQEPVRIDRANRTSVVRATPHAGRRAAPMPESAEPVQLD